MRREVIASSSTSNSLDLRVRKSGFTSCYVHIKYFHFKMKDIIDLPKENKIFKVCLQILPVMLWRRKKNHEGKSTQN